MAIEAEHLEALSARTTSEGRKEPDYNQLQDQFDPVQRTIYRETGSVPVVVDFPQEGTAETVKRNISFISPDGTPQAREYAVTFHTAQTGLPLSIREDPQGHLIRLTGADVKAVVDYNMGTDKTYRVLHLNTHPDSRGLTRSFQTPGSRYLDASYSGQERKAHGYMLSRNPK